MTTEATTDDIEMKTVDEEALTSPEIILIHKEGMPATKRCARCEAQAYVEIEVFDTEERKTRRLEFCAHHFTEHESVLMSKALRVVDYRPFLLVQESRFKGLNER